MEEIEVLVSISVETGVARITTLAYSGELTADQIDTIRDIYNIDLCGIRGISIADQESHFGPVYLNIVIDPDTLAARVKSCLPRVFANEAEIIQTCLSINIGKQFRKAIKQSDKLTYSSLNLNDAVLVDIKVSDVDFLKDADVKAVSQAPLVPARKGVILRGENLPPWLYGALLSHYHATQYVAIWDEKLSQAVVVETHTPRVGLGERIDLQEA